MTTLETLTDAQIDSLRTAAGSAGDAMMAAICQLALEGTVRDDYEGLHYAEHNRLRRMSQTEARAAVVEAIRDAEGQVTS
jgi:hypothetical protein